MNQTERRKFYRKDTDIQTERFTVNRQTEVLDERKSNMNWQTEILFVRNTHKYVDWFRMNETERERKSERHTTWDFVWMKQIHRHTNWDFVWMKRRNRQTVLFEWNGDTNRQTDIVLSARALDFSFGRSSQVRWPQEICFQFRADRATDNSNKNYVEVKNKNYWNIWENFLIKSFITKQSTWSN